MRLSKKPLQDLTDKFIKEFCELAHAEAVKEKKASKSPHMVSDKRDDSFAFSVYLPECLGYNKMGINSTKDDHPLIGMGFVDRLAKIFFQNSIKGFHKDVLFILKNHKNQYPYDDYSLKNFKENVWSETKEEFNIDSCFDQTAPKTKIVTRNYRDVTFTIHNSKNSFVGYIVVNFIDGELEKINLYKEDTKTLQLTIDFDKQFRMGGKDKQRLITTLTEKPELTHYKYIADINSFFYVMNQIFYGIKDHMKPKKKKTT